MFESTNSGGYHREICISVHESAVKEDLENFIGEHTHLYLSILEVIFNDKYKVILFS